MCNLYSMTTNQEAIRRLFKVTRDQSGNMPSFPAIFPDNVGPIILNLEGKRTLMPARWGMPGPAKFGGHPIANIRNTESSYWKRWLSPAHRCLVPFTSFSEYDQKANPKSLKNADGSPHAMAGKKDVVWFALNEKRPLAAFAGIWTVYAGVRGTKANPIEGPHNVYGFLTTEPNTVVEPIHSKAMPVILHPDDWDTWLNAESNLALQLQQPWPDTGLKIVARGASKSDGKRNE